MHVERGDVGVHGHQAVGVVPVGEVSAGRLQPGVLGERPADAEDDAAHDLAARRLGVDDPAAVHHGGPPVAPDLFGVPVHPHLAEVGRE